MATSDSPRPISGPPRRRSLSARRATRRSRSSRLHGEASDAGLAADAAVKAAEQGVEDADKYSKLIKVRMVHGESMTAQQNAQTVLNAKAAVDQAVTDANAAKEAAETAKTEAEGLPEDTAGRSALIAALDAAIEEADDAIDAAEDSQKHADLMAAVTAVQGSNAKKPITPKKVGEGVAKAVGAALGPTSDDRRQRAAARRIGRN